MHKRRITALAAAGIIATGVVVVARSDDPSNSSRPAADTTTLAETITRGASRELFKFDDLATMVATSALVVDASVVRTEPGVNSGTGHGHEAYTNAILSVNEVLYGDRPSGTIAVEELTESAGQPIQLDGLEHLDVGDSGILFLRPSVHGNNYVLTNSQGRYLAGGDGDLRGATQQNALIDRLSNRSRAELKADIENAVKAISAGKVKAKPYPLGAPRPRPEP